ncbi:CHAD domain-containing protein [Paenarthrobacter sp. NPDC092416]|uniref:CHAD domain-containing protein n=1 Tax=Paenarthrobacter sp. NPDC092416 TaxID=3364386 RepID=UPI0038011F9A
MGSDVRDSLSLYIAFQLTELEGYLPLIAAADQEAVHSARLALRRLRSVLSCYEPLLPHVPKPEHKDVRWLARSLGEARDAYVLGKRITLSLDASDAWRAPDPLQEAVRVLMSASNRSAARLGSDERARRTIHACREALLSEGSNGQPRLRKNGSPHRMADVAELLQQQWEAIQRSLGAEAAAVGEEERSELLHRARKDIKGLRYSVEAVAEVIGPAATAIIQPAVGMQRILGELHDSVVATDWIDGLSGLPGVDGLDRQELRLMEQRRMAKADAQFRAAGLEYPLPAPRRVLLF